jgi:tetratricopeptide (TPR) repeat protein
MSTIDSDTKFICKRCKRQLITDICTIHGRTSVVPISHFTDVTSVAKQPPAGCESALQSTEPTQAKEINPTKFTSPETSIPESANNSDADAQPKQSENGNNEEPLRRIFGDFPMEVNDKNVDDKSEEITEDEALTSLIENQLNNLKEKSSDTRQRPGEPTLIYTILESELQEETKWYKRFAKYSGLFAAAALFVFAMYAYIYPRYDMQARFEKAEALFAAQEFRKAKAQYELFALKYPLDSKIGIVKSRLEALEKLEQKEREKQQKIRQLMEKATLAFKQQHYLTPEDDNVILYLNQVLSLEPNFSMAQTLREQIVNKYFSLAETALAREDYDKAVTFFQNILQIMPGDQAILQQIDRALALQKLDKQLHKLTQLARAKEDIRALKREIAMLKTEIQKEQQKLQVLRRLQDQNNTVRAEAPTPNPNEISGSIMNTVKTNDEPQLSDLGIELLSPPQEVKLVEETFIDGGKKEYIQKVKPHITNLKKSSTGVTLVLAECVVDTNGYVTEVKLVNGTDDQRLNQVAVESFKQYRYKPATFNGNPVRFKSLEVLTF